METQVVTPSIALFRSRVAVQIAPMQTASPVTLNSEDKVRIVHSVHCK